MFKIDVTILSLTAANQASNARQKTETGQIQVAVTFYT